MSQFQEDAQNLKQSAQMIEEIKTVQKPSEAGAAPSLQQNHVQANDQNKQIRESEQNNAQNKNEQQPQKQQPVQQTILKQLKQLNQTVIYDISVKKGRKQKFINHMSNIQSMQKNFQNQIDNFTQDVKSSIYEKFSIIYYNMARLGQNQVALQTAILLLDLSKSSRYLLVRWKMQLAAMKSSISHKGAYKVAVQAMSHIIRIIQDLAHNLKQSKPKLSGFLQLVLKVIKSERKNDFIWVHNFQNNMKCFTDHIRQLMISSSKSDQQSIEDTQQGKDELMINSSNNLKIQSFFPGYDFQIADYMSLQKLQIDYIEKYNEVADIKQIAKEIVIYASICCFTQATQNYYMGNYSLKYLHFKAVEIALLAVDKECTYVGFLLKILNDYYGTKMSEIRQQNSQLMEINQLKRRMPRDKRQVSLKNLCFADQ